MSYRRIAAALDSRLLEFQSDHIAFPGRLYRPAKGIGFLAVAFLPKPGTAHVLGAGASQAHGGQYRITVTEPGSAALLTKIDALRAHFHRGLILEFEGLDVHIDGAAVGETTGGLADPALPLSITWRSYF